MEKILEQIDGIISGVFYLPKSDATDMILADLQDLRNMVASQQSVHWTAATPCPYCKKSHDKSIACPEYAAQSAAAQ